MLFRCDSAQQVLAVRVALSELPGRPILNLGTLGYIDLAADALLLRSCSEANPGRLHAIVLLVHPGSHALSKPLVCPAWRHKQEPFGQKLIRYSPNHMQRWLKYFVIAVLAWAMVDFTTTAAIGHPRAYYSSFMPALLLFYIGYPLTFSALIYKFRLTSTALFLAMIVGIVVVEVVFTHNMLLLTWPVCLLAIPISLGHYAMVTFMPLWIAEGTMKENRKWVIATLGLWALGVLLNVLTQFGSNQGPR